MVKPRPVRWPPPGTRTSSSIPATDGAVLPILHLNGYKIANPAVLARIPRSELEELLRGYGWTPHFVEGDDPARLHVAMAATLDTVVAVHPGHPGRRAHRRHRRRARRGR